MSREKCITCEEDTPYHFSTDIEYRSHYIEGAGQLCRECYMKGSSEGREHISIPKHFVKTYSNNAELGERVRRYYYDNY